VERAQSRRLGLPWGESVTTLAYGAAPDRRAGITLILAPGAGAPQLSDFMRQYAAGLAARGIDVVTFNFAYQEAKRRVPDRNERLETCYRRVVESVRETLGGNRLAIGGKSMGGRIATQLAAAGAGELLGLVLLGYPLHPPGKPAQQRAQHLAAIATPLLIVQGARDNFGTPEELRAVVPAIPASVTLHVVADADHSLKVPKKAEVPQERAHHEVQDAIAEWLRRLAEGS
jgi:uncharacterized protein